MCNNTYISNCAGNILRDIMNKNNHSFHYSLFFQDKIVQKLFYETFYTDIQMYAKAFNYDLEDSDVYNNILIKQ